MTDFEAIISVFEDFVLETRRTKKRQMKTGNIHVFQGGECSVQSTPFKNAIYRSNFARDSVKIRYLTTNDVKKMKWSARQLVSWLLNCDVHFILSHVHQGLSQLGWHMTTIQKELRRLCFHPGFPSGNELLCPVFLQDKFRYIKAVPHLTNATVRIPLLRTYTGTHWPSTIASWCEWNNEKCGWVLKLPYTTNSEFVKFPKTIEDVLTSLESASIKFASTIPYIMLQPCMENRKEYKVVVFNGKFSHLAENRLKCGHAFSTKPFTDLQCFAERAVKELKAADKTFICDGLVRVDVFCDCNGIFRVNEFESLEANYYNKAHSKVETEFVVSEQLSEYWMSKVVENVAALV